jgi:hypothetical protein
VVVGIAGVLMEEISGILHRPDTGPYYVAAIA